MKTSNTTNLVHATLVEQHLEYKKLDDWAEVSTGENATSYNRQLTMQEMHMWRTYSTNSHNIVWAAAKGIARVMDRCRLADYGGPVTLSVASSKSLLKSMKFTRRQGSTKISGTFHDFTEAKQMFLSKIAKTVKFEEIPGVI